jgi:hypothetical protein
MIIGLLGQAGAGKTTSAELLAKTLKGATIISVAAPIKSMLYGLGLQPSDFEKKIKERPIGWVGASPRHLMQTLGDWGRGVNQSLWVNLAESRITTALLNGATHVILDDIRTPLEASLVRRFNGVLFRIERPGLPSGTHMTERAQTLIDADYTIQNTGGLDKLKQDLDDALQEFG